MTKKAIVIGAGIGGLSVAARLLNQGYDVEIFEKNLSTGGKTNFFKYKDFKFDLTASLILFPDDYKEIFRYCNKDYKNYFKMIPLDKLYKVFYSDLTSYSFYSDLPKLTSLIKNISKCYPEDIEGYFNFLSSNYEKYLLAERTTLNNNFTNSNTLLKSISLSTALKFNVFTSCYKDALKYIVNPKLLNFLMFQSLYVGVSPYSSPSIYNIIPTVAQFDGLYHIEGGMYSYVKSLEKLVIDLGGRITNPVSVEKILFQQNKAIGVMANGIKYFSDIVVCSSDFSYTIDKLIQNKYIKSNLNNPEDFKYSCSTFILYIGLNKKYTNLNIHNIYINNDFEESIKNIFNGNMPSSFPMYIYCPSSIDNSFCPEGYETLNVMIRVPNLIYSNFKWNEENINKLKKQILLTLSNIPELNDILDHIVFTKYITPIDFEQKFNTYGGCAFGLSHTLNQSAIFRPQCALPSIRNLYFTGASIHPGNGVSMVLKSSKVCADYIKNNNN